MIRKTYFEWKEYYLSELRYKGRGRKDGYKRPAWLPAPTAEERLALALFLARRKKIPAPPKPTPIPSYDLGYFGKAYPGVFLNNPRGGVEDVAEMARAGIKVVYLNVGDFPAASWDLVRQRAKLLGVLVMPWARCRNALDVINLCNVGKAWGCVSIVVNLEDEAKDVLPPSKVSELLEAHWGPSQVGISTVVWLYNSVNWTPLALDVIMLQYFPAEVPFYKGKLSDCVWHARQMGVELLHYTYGTYWGADPSWYDMSLPHSLFTGDTIGVGNWHKWS
jgi:hypothetical protein